ncbi:hypothetical protein RCL1_000987 [Eukaryota sp. TZLM3-RCL]
MSNLTPQQLQALQKVKDVLTDQFPDKYLIQCLIAQKWLVEPVINELMEQSQKTEFKSTVKPKAKASKKPHYKSNNRRTPPPASSLSEATISSSSVDPIVEAPPQETASSTSTPEVPPKSLPEAETPQPVTETKPKRKYKTKNKKSTTTEIVEAAGSQVVPSPEPLPEYAPQPGLVILPNIELNPNITFPPVQQHVVPTEEEVSPCTDGLVYLPFEIPTEEVRFGSFGVGKKVDVPSVLSAFVHPYLKNLGLEPEQIATPKPSSFVYYP